MIRESDVKLPKMIQRAERDDYVFYESDSKRKGYKEQSAIAI
jgi:hypothetical protein